MHKKRYIFKFASEVTTEIKKQGLCCIVLLFSFDLKILSAHTSYHKPLWLPIKDMENNFTLLEGVFIINAIVIDIIIIIPAPTLIYK